MTRTTFECCGRSYPMAPSSVNYKRAAFGRRRRIHWISARESFEPSACVSCASINSRTPYKSTFNTNADSLSVPGGQPAKLRRSKTGFNSGRHQCPIPAQIPSSRCRSQWGLSRRDDCAYRRDSRERHSFSPLIRSLEKHYQLRELADVTNSA
jgi:hypothetical protein